MNIEKIIDSKLAMKLAKKFPKTAFALAFYLSSLNEPKPETEVYVDYCEIDNGEHQLRRQGWCPVSVAYNNKWISEEVYNKIKSRE